VKIVVQLDGVQLDGDSAFPVLQFAQHTMMAQGPSYPYVSHARIQDVLCESLIRVLCFARIVVVDAFDLPGIVAPLLASLSTPQ